jgi:hypothetical protein
MTYQPTTLWSTLVHTENPICLFLHLFSPFNIIISILFSLFYCFDSYLKYCQFPLFFFLYIINHKNTKKILFFLRLKFELKIFLSKTCLTVSIFICQNNHSKWMIWVIRIIKLSSYDLGILSNWSSHTSNYLMIDFLIFKWSHASSFLLSHMQ